jgi:hypothetical protein
MHTHRSYKARQAKQDEIPCYGTVKRAGRTLRQASHCSATERFTSVHCGQGQPSELAALPPPPPPPPLLPARTRLGSGCQPPPGAPPSSSLPDAPVRSTTSGHLPGACGCCSWVAAGWLARGASACRAGPSAPGHRRRGAAPNAATIAAAAADEPRPGPPELPGPARAEDGCLVLASACCLALASACCCSGPPAPSTACSAASTAPPRAAVSRSNRSLGHHTLSRARRSAAKAAASRGVQPCRSVGSPPAQVTTSAGTLACRGEPSFFFFSAARAGRGAEWSGEAVRLAAVAVDG